MVLTYKVKENDNYKILKDVLEKEFNISKRLLITLKKTNSIFLNNICVYVNSIVNPNDTITVALNYEEENSNIVPTKMNLDILYEDEYYIVINKPSAIAIHPVHNHYSTSLSNGIKYYFNSINLHKKIRPVNRLDKDTSGIVIFAKNEYIQECLIKQMKKNMFQKQYIAILNGLLKQKQGTINEPIARKENSIIERCISKNGDNSITHFEVIKYLENLTIVKLRLETGRTHQIRVHTKYIGFPILGDTLYNKPSLLINRQALHAYKVSFLHPITQEKVEYIAPIPEDMQFIGDYLII